MSLGSCDGTFLSFSQGSTKAHPKDKQARQDKTTQHRCIIHKQETTSSFKKLILRLCKDLVFYCVLCQVNKLDN